MGLYSAFKIQKNETLAFVITGIFIVFTCTYLIPRGFKIPALIFLFTISSVFWCMFRYIRSKQIQMINSRFNHEANLRNQSNIEAISANTEGIPRVIPGSNRFNQPYFTFEVIPNTAPIPRAGLSNTNTVTRPLPAQSQISLPSYDDAIKQENQANEELPPPEYSEIDLNPRVSQ